MDEGCPDCGGEQHTGSCRAHIGGLLAEVKMLREVDWEVSHVLLTIADLQARVQELERQEREWH